ncbi:MAG: EAL domain-containing protein [Synergistaceae bacterium]|jgi:lactose/cellobiose-specific phosphotransferase system IIC component|nr:EAL domain-containing protein [Synergistaceae bacterium]
MDSEQSFGSRNEAFWLRMAASPSLSIVRDSLTFVFPVLISGAIALLINNFPLASYQDFMQHVFGPGWRNFGKYVWNGTLAILSPLTVCTLGYRLCELYNDSHQLRPVHPLIVGMISLCSLIVMLDADAGSSGIQQNWVRLHGLFLAIIVAFASSKLFLWMWDAGIRLNFSVETPSSIMDNAFSSLLPGVITISAFAVFNSVMGYLGYQDINMLTYEIICRPFVRMGNNLLTAVLFNFMRQFLWFCGIHGSNALEPVMTELYSSSAALGGPLSRTFFDCYVTMGGSGNTLSLLLALIVARRGKNIGMIAKMSILPAIFNINEVLLFGLPIVMNPVFFVPFLASPIALTIIGYIAFSVGAVSASNADVIWTTPVIFSGYAASGGYSGVMLQVFNLAVGTAIYMPFVHIYDRMWSSTIEKTYGELKKLSYTFREGQCDDLLRRNDGLGTLTRSLAADLFLSIEKNELYLEYQPQVDCRDGRVCGVEALLRWNHWRVGMVPPSLFIPLAEKTGFIGELGLWVCDESCRQAAAWSERGIDGVVMSFNVSVKQLDDPDLPEKVASLMEKTGVAPGKMKLEVTESTGLSSNMGHNVILQDLKRTGIAIAIDDFGMGYTSLVYLKQFPVSMIKLDGSLVRDVATNTVTMNIISSISELCRAMDIQLLAEFVETENQAKTLKSLGCCVFQGYLYSPPLRADDCEKVIRKGFKSF